MAIKKYSGQTMVLREKSEERGKKQEVTTEEVYPLPAG